MANNQDAAGKLPTSVPTSPQADADQRDSRQHEVRPPNVVSMEASQAGFDAMCQSFETARRHHPDEYIESSYTLAGRVVQIRCVGRDLAAIYQRSFAPRATFHTDAAPAPISPHLSIDLWDEAVTGQPYPQLGKARDSQPPLGEQIQFHEASGRLVWIREYRIATWLDRKANRFVGWRAHSAQVPVHERSKPLSALLPLWFYDQGIHILHAGMVARNSTGVLITGGSGIGKTTTTLCCLLAGLDILSDDQLAVMRPQTDGGKFIAHSIFQSARVLPDHLERFPALKPHAIKGQLPKDPKALLFLAEQFPTRVVPQATVRAIALPRLAGQAQTSFQRATRVEALNYMARTSLMTPYGIGRARFVHMTALLGSAPCYWLNLGHDLTQIPPAVDRLITEA